MNLSLNLQYEDTFKLIVKATCFTEKIKVKTNKHSNTTILVSLELKPLFVLKWGRKMISHIHEATVLVLTQLISPYMHNSL